MRRMVLGSVGAAISGFYLVVRLFVLEGGLVDTIAVEIDGKMVDIHYTNNTDVLVMVAVLMLSIALIYYGQKGWKERKVRDPKSRHKARRGKYLSEPIYDANQKSIPSVYGEILPYPKQDRQILGENKLHCPYCHSTQIKYAGYGGDTPRYQCNNKRCEYYGRVFT